VLVAGRGVLRGEPRPEQQRVVGAEGNPGAGVDEAAQRDGVQRGVDPEGHVGRRAHLERYPRVDHPGEQLAVLSRAHAVPQPGGGQGVQGVPHVVRAEQLAAVRQARQAGPRRDPEGGCEVRRVTAPLVVGQSETDHLARAVAGIPGGQPCQRPGVEGVADPARGDDHRDLAGGGSAGLAGGVQHDLQSGGEAAHERRVRGGVDLQLQPARPFGGVVLSRLEHQPAHVVGVPHAGPGRVVEPLEAEPTPFVGSQPQQVVLAQGLGQPDAVLVGELDERLRAHAAGEVQVQVRLRQRVHRPNRLPNRLPNRWPNPLHGLSLPATSGVPEPATEPGT
jgi:hypothetical protein